MGKGRQEAHHRQGANEGGRGGSSPPNIFNKFVILQIRPSFVSLSLVSLLYAKAATQIIAKMTRRDHRRENLGKTCFPKVWSNCLPLSLGKLWARPWSWRVDQPGWRWWRHTCQHRARAYRASSPTTHSLAQWFGIGFARGLGVRSP